MNVYSNRRKLALSGWLKENDPVSYNKSLKLQKFLLFYELFCKISNKKADFSHLKGYKNGPVFSVVWGDYTKGRKLFDQKVLETYNSWNFNIDQEIAKKSSFLVQILTEKELSDLTHKMNIWKSKEARIMSGEPQVVLEEKDFDEKDRELIETLNEAYPIDMIDNSSIISIKEKNFVFSKSNIKLLNLNHIDILSELSEQEHLHNPVFVEIDENGVLLVD